MIEHQQTPFIKVLMILSLFLISSLFARGQSNGIFDVNFEFQAYPTGLMPGIRLEKGFAEKNAMHLRIAYNWVRHRDLGVHEDERGGGLGFSVGYKRYFKENFQGLFLGLRNDFWFNEIDWKDHIDLPNEISGTTKITVIQPTAEAGYLFDLGNSWILAPTLSFGYEVNVKTEGEPTGEGPILLLGVNIGKRF